MDREKVIEWYTQSRQARKPMDIQFHDPENAHAQVIGAPINDKGHHDLKAVELLKDDGYKIVAYTGAAWKNNLNEWEIDEHDTISVDSFPDLPQATAYFIARCFQFLT